MRTKCIPGTREVRQLAALVASNVYYHLGRYVDSLSYSLGVKTLFNMTSTDIHQIASLGREKSSLTLHVLESEFLSCDIVFCLIVLMLSVREAFTSLNMS